jgi:hypothetical protein
MNKSHNELSFNLLELALGRQYILVIRKKTILITVIVTKSQY